MLRREEEVLERLTQMELETKQIRERIYRMLENRRISEMQT